MKTRILTISISALFSYTCLFGDVIWTDPSTGYEWYGQKTATEAYVCLLYIQAKNLVVPSEVLGLPVTRIVGYDGGMSPDTLESVTIPSTVKRIERNAFRGKSRLKDIYIQGDRLDLEYLYPGVFDECNLDLIIHIPGSSSFRSKVLGGRCIQRGEEPIGSITNYVFTTVTNVVNTKSEVCYYDTSARCSVVTGVLNDVQADLNYPLITAQSIACQIEYDIAYLYRITASGIGEWTGIPSTYSGKPIKGSFDSIDISAARVVFPECFNVIYTRDFSNKTNIEGLVFCCTNALTVCKSKTGYGPDVAFEGCDNLKLLAFYGPPPVQSEDSNPVRAYRYRGVVDTGILAFTKAIMYEKTNASEWERMLNNLGYGGTSICFEGAWPNIKILSIRGQSPDYVAPPTMVTNYVHETVTNVIYRHDVVTNVIEHQHYTTVTNVVRYVPEPGTSPAPGYSIDAGATGALQIEGAAGWDAYGVPDGMTWNQSAGVLSGAANKSGIYDLLLVSGSGTETKIMRTTLEVKGYATIVGHVGVAFSKSGAPVNCLKSYKTLSAGLKWDAKTKILSGIPTKAQTLSYETVYGDPVTIEIKPAETTMAGTYNGMIGYRVEEGEGDPWHAIGNLTVTAAATGKLSAKVVVPQGTYSFSASAWDSVSDGIYRVVMSTKAGDKLCIVLDTTTDWKLARIVSSSTFQIAKDANTYIASAWRNEHGKTDAIAKDPVASEFISRIKALKKMYLKATKVDDDHYTLEAQTAAKGADVTLTFNANGTVAYSGKVGSTKVSGSSTLAVDDDSYYTIFDLVVPVSKTRAMHFAMGFEKGPSSTPIPDFEIAVSNVL